MPINGITYAGSMCVLELYRVDLQYLLQGATFSGGIAVNFVLIKNNFITTSKPINCILTSVGQFIANGVCTAAP